MLRVTCTLPEILQMAAANDMLQNGMAVAGPELGSGTNSLNANQEIFCLITDPQGNIYAGGNFSNRNSGRYIAKWNGSTWSEVGTGVNTLNVNSSILTITFDPLGNLYAGGYFTNSNDRYFVAKWNGTSWSELGIGGNELNADWPILSMID